MRDRRARRRRSSSAVLGALPLILTAVAVAAGSAAHIGEEPPAPAEFRAVSTAGALGPANSLAGQAVLKGENLRPGDTVSGTVTIANPATDPTTAALSASNLSDAPGPAGGVLSDRLVLSVADVSVPSQPLQIFQGSLRDLNGVAAGEFAPESSRKYQFVVRFVSDPLAGAAGGDNRYAGATVSVDFLWSATGSGGADPVPVTPPPPAPDPVPMPAPAPDLGPVPAPAPDPGPAPAPDPGPAPAHPDPVPAPTIVGSKLLAVQPGGMVRSRVRCPGETPCRATLVVSLPSRPGVPARKLVLARRTVTIAPGQTKTLPVRLNARSRRMLQSSGQRRVRIAIRMAR